MPYNLNDIQDELELDEMNMPYYNSKVRIEGMGTMVCNFCKNYLINVERGKYRCICGRLFFIKNGHLVDHSKDPKMEFDTRNRVLDIIERRRNRWA